VGGKGACSYASVVPVEATPDWDGRARRHATNRNAVDQRGGSKWGNWVETTQSQGRARRTLRLRAPKSERR